METLTDLRVLNLAGNMLSVVEGLNKLSALTELNLRRNSIKVGRTSCTMCMRSHSYMTNTKHKTSPTKPIFPKTVKDLDALPALQRIFLSHNRIASIDDIAPIFNVRYLIELSMDGNPLSELDAIGTTNTTTINTTATAATIALPLYDIAPPPLLYPLSLIKPIKQSLTRLLTQSLSSVPCSDGG
jgi:Leucine-rich repeat (LRR) protein